MFNAKRFLYCGAVFLMFIACRTTNEEGSEVLDSSSPPNAADSFNLTEKNFFDGNVNELHILMHGDTWNKVTMHTSQGGNACSDNTPYGHIKELKFINKKTGETTVINNAGIRVKGNTSCDDPIEQKSFKIKLNPVDKFIEDQNGQEVWRFQNVFEEWGKRLNYPDSAYKTIKKQHLYGLKSFSIRRGGADPTRLRDALASDVFEYGGHLARTNNVNGAPERGGAVYRGGLVWVRIHNGLGNLIEGHYGMVELVDDDMIESHYSKNTVSHLFKIKDAKGTFLDSDMPANRDRLLSWYEPELIDGESYTGNEEYDIKQNLCSQGKYDTSKCDALKQERIRAEAILREFKQQLTEAVQPANQNERRTKLSAFLDTDNILSYMAAANLTGHWDSLVGAMSNNDYLFHNKKSDRWGIIAWDLDNTFGAGNENYPWMASITDFGVNMKYRPLFKAVLDNFGNEYRQRMQDFLNGVYEHDRIGNRITSLRDAMTPGSQDEIYQNIFKFKNHRWGNAWCNLKNGNSSKVKIKNGWPDIYKEHGSYKAACQ